MHHIVLQAGGTKKMPTLTQTFHLLIQEELIANSTLDGSFLHHYVNFLPEKSLASILFKMGMNFKHLFLYILLFFVII